jgi:predicted ABC-class ATPase
MGTRTARDLRHKLDDIDRRGYPAYKDLRGVYAFAGFDLAIDHVQGDPFAAPSGLACCLSNAQAGWPRELFDTPWRRVAFEDFLVRRFCRAAARWSHKVGGSGKSGLLATSRPGPEVLERSACVVGSKGLELRFEAGFPAHGRTVDAGALARMLFDFVPRIVDEALVCHERDLDQARAVADLADDQHFMRGELDRLGLVAFVADGSVLPRESGVSARPMRGALAFESPQSMRVTLELPHHGPTPGMGIRRGVTLVVGGGYHGKSTLLQALQEGVYDHVAGDGREYVACDAGAMKLRAEDRRAVHGVDISLFIDNLPNGADTRAFSTADASGSTSQAASTCEALEAGCRTLLIDEDTSATNFMVRDSLMAAVVSAEHEPITPFVERVRGLWEQEGVSSVIVVGSSGAFFGVADAVLQMDSYRCLDITQRVREICGCCKERKAAAVAPLVQPGEKTRLLDLSAASSQAPGTSAGCEDVDASSGATRVKGHGGRGGKADRVKVRSSRDSIQVGNGSVDLRLVEQLADSEQAAALAQMVRLATERGLLAGGCTVGEVCRVVFDELGEVGLDALDPHGTPGCGLAMPRLQEFAAALNRWRP